MKQLPSLISGLAGSLTLTLLHELLKKNVSAPPRMDKLGKQALSKVLTASGIEVPSDDNLQKITLSGDVVGNMMYYSMVGIRPESSLLTGAVIGLAAGLGAVALPSKLGLNKKYSNATSKTQVLTVLLYLSGGLVAGAVHQAFGKK